MYLCIYLLTINWLCILLIAKTAFHTRTKFIRAFPYAINGIGSQRYCKREEGENEINTITMMQIMFMGLQ
jgi:hypothetical protein